jgi:hypothetical protein
MVAAVMARAWIAGAAILPWLVLLPLHGVAAVLAQSVTLIAAFHGAGLIVARSARATPPDALLAIPWGAAALVAASGLATAFRLGTLELHASLVFGCAAVHTAALAIRVTDRVARAEQALASPAAWLVPGALLVALGAAVIISAAADGLVQPFDDDGHVVAQLARLLQTGALGDPIGFARDHQLGGQVALGALAAAASESFAARLVESLAFSLTLALALSRIGGAGGGAGAALWRMLVVIAASALALAALDPHPSWTATCLALALYLTIGDLDPAPPLPVALLAGALAALRFELVPLAAVAVWIAWWRDRSNHRRTAVLLLGLAAVVLPFAIARAAAWSHVAPDVHALMQPPRGGWPVRAVLALAVAAPSALVLQLVVPASRALRWAGIATACALGGLATGATGSGAYAIRFAWPIGIAFALLAIIEITRVRPPRADSLAQPPRLASGPAALIAVLLLCVLLYEGREAPGRLRWSRRMTAAASAIDQLQRPPAEPPDPYRALLATVPRGATIAVWVGEPERLDYTRFRIVDLRTPAGARLRAFRWQDHRSKLEAIVTQVGAAYLLIEDDDARVRRAQTDVMYRVLCQTERPICADDLEAIAARHPVIARRAGVQLVDLRR